MWLVIIQVILSALLAVFLMTCIRIKHRNGNRKIPRILVATAVLLSLIPLAGLFVFVLFIVAISVFHKYIELKDNRFTRFWIKD
jgi:hypothetical protein